MTQEQLINEMSSVLRKAQLAIVKLQRKLPISKDCDNVAQMAQNMNNEISEFINVKLHVDTKPDKKINVNIHQLANRLIVVNTGNDTNIDSLKESLEKVLMSITIDDESHPNQVQENHE